MPPKQSLRVVLCWHMHQPDYRDLISKEIQQPWTYLHAIKDYVDMAAHLEAVPDAKAVVNFSAVLLDQLQDYCTQVRGFLTGATAIHDPVLAALDTAVFPAELEQRLGLVRACLRAHRGRIIAKFPQYERLAKIAEFVAHDHSAGAYLSNQYLADVVTWYHIGWLGETVRRENPFVKGLIDQGAGFTLHERRGLLELIATLLESLPERYRRLADAGRIELSLSPYGHPMLPLLLDFDTARAAAPDTRLPVLEQYPGGPERVSWHLQEGLRAFERFFGCRPRGCWPSEGGISAAALELIAEAGFEWIATGETVLRNSLGRNEANDNHELRCPYVVPGSSVRLVARDDTLSDLIGFTYADWHADDAVGDLVHRLQTIAAGNAHRSNAIVPIILDGENAWEHYPDNAYHFLSALYRRLAEEPGIELTTFRDALAAIEPRQLANLVPGSWVYGNFSTWIGDEDKNRAWDILGDVKRVYDSVIGTLDAQQAACAERQLAACEGSDWFWWFGDYNPAETVSDFERLFRLHIANLYQMLGKEPPQYLSQTLSHGSGAPELGGVMRHGRRDHAD